MVEEMGLFERAHYFIAWVFELELRGRPITFWLHAVRVPLVAFFLGVCARESLILLPVGLLIMVIGVYYPLGMSVLWIAFALRYFGHADWPVCFLLCWWFDRCIESRCHFLHTKRQVGDLLTDFFSINSNYELQELEISSSILRGFRGYEVKKEVLNSAYEWIVSQIPAARKLYIQPSAPFRLFSFSTKEGKNATGTAAAYPISRYSSLIFARQDLEQMTDAQRLQLYHELGHGTLEGTEVFMRLLRWEIVESFDFLMLIVMVVLCTDLPGFWRRALPIGLILLANWFRRLAIDNTKRITIGASEVYADSLAMSHPDFAETGKSKTRVENRLSCLLDEASSPAVEISKFTTLWFRINWLRRWLSLGFIPRYKTRDIDLRIHVAFPLYILAGYFANPSLRYFPIIMWGLVAAVVLGMASVSHSARGTNELLFKLDGLLPKREPVPVTPTV